ncbi:hypothetical protein ABTY98_00770 [Streptomyces sp. NPDC096040]|uniref:SCO2400 family protein n=1 Tax=Streptomyces sp. NPDC096040 TaxID=3155541 RepID=UPI0033270800
MDYCHPCRRHLNGALACPGCGAQVESLRASAPEATAPDLATHGETPYTETEFAGDDGHGGAGGYDGEGGDGYDDEGDEPLAGGRAERRRAARGHGGRSRGRAAESLSEGVEEPSGADGSRRDRKAAAHRRRRRRILLVSAACVLAAGCLSLAELGTDAIPFTSPGPASAGGDTADGGTATPSPGTTAQPLDDTSGATGTASSASADPSASPSPSASKDKASGSPSASPKDTSAQSATTGAGTGTSTNAPTAAPTSTAASTPTADPTASDPTPSPSQSHTCTRFLWWCS